MREWMVKFEKHEKLKEIKTMKKYILTLMAAAMAVVSVSAAELEVAGGVDFVSSYNWRGMQQSGPALQPGASVSIAGVSLSAWGSNSFDQGAITNKELDFTLAYEIGGFSVGYNNYWWTGEEDAFFGAEDHLSEVFLGYTFGDSFPLSLGVSTMLDGDGVDADGNNFYSTYVELSYPFAVSSVDCAFTVGMTPWTGMYSGANGGFEVASLALNFSKSIVETENFTLPMFVDLSFSPAQKMAYLVAGLSFGF